MKKSLLIFLLAQVVSVYGVTPITDLKITGTASQIASGAFAVKTGVTVTGEAGSTFNFAASNLIFADAQIPWAKVNKTSSSLADLATRSFLNLSDAPASYSGQGGKVVKVNTGATGLEFGTAGVSTFIGLSDAPSSYSGQGGKIVKVNSGATGLEFGNAPASAFTGLTDVPSSYSGQGGKTVRVNTGASALEFVTAPTVATTSAPLKGDGSGNAVAGNPSTLAFATTAIPASAIDWSTSQSFSKTLGANTTFTFSNDTDGQAIVVAVTNTTSNYTVTWPTVSWSGGVAPVQSIGATTDIYTFVKIGSTIYGSAIPGAQSAVVARIYHNATVSIANDTTTLLQFNSELWDTRGLHDNATNNSRLTAPVSGAYSIKANIRFGSHAAATTRQIVIRKNAGGAAGGGTLEEVVRVPSIAADGADFPATVDVYLAAGDYIEVFVYQNSGAALDASYVSPAACPSVSMFLIAAF